MNAQPIVGIDISKDVLQVCTSISGTTSNSRVDRKAASIYFTSLTRSIVAMEACATANYWGRELQRLGHDVRIIPPQYVKAFVKRDKTDARDAFAILEAVQRPDMIWYKPKTIVQQDLITVHRTRALLSKTNVAHTNALRGFFAEFGIVERTGRAGAARLASKLDELPPGSAAACSDLLASISLIQEQIKALNSSIIQYHRNNELSVRLSSIPGVGPLSATALISTVADAAMFPSSRVFSSWLGLTPRVRSSGARIAHGGISKRGDAYLRRLLVMGATSAIRWVANNPDPWLRQILIRKPKSLTQKAVALA